MVVVMQASGEGVASLSWKQDGGKMLMVRSHSGVWKSHPASILKTGGDLNVLGHYIKYQTTCQSTLYENGIAS